MHSYSSSCWFLVTHTHMASAGKETYKSNKTIKVTLVLLSACLDAINTVLPDTTCTFPDTLVINTRFLASQARAKHTFSTLPKVNEDLILNECLLSDIEAWASIDSHQQQGSCNSQDQGTLHGWRIVGQS